MVAWSAVSADLSVVLVLEAARAILISSCALFFSAFSLMVATMDWPKRSRLDVFTRIALFTSVDTRHASALAVIGGGGGVRAAAAYVPPAPTPPPARGALRVHALTLARKLEPGMEMTVGRADAMLDSANACTRKTLRGASRVLRTHSAPVPQPGTSRLREGPMSV